jgi:5-(aminomethyl)-3-furanmethanol phosphate kinase
LNFELVLKLGGSLLRTPDAFDRVLAAVERLAAVRPLVIVPGGGPFADAVRDVDRRIGLPDDAAHWMAVLAMDQYAHVIASRLARGRVVTSAHEAAEARAARGVPVLAPYRWLRDADPLPHSWDVTGDSIAAWVAAQLGASVLVLVKAPGASGELVDPYFNRAVQRSAEAIVVSADAIDSLVERLAAST